MPATATLTQQDGLWIVGFTNTTNFTVGQQVFGHINAALRFIRLRGLRVVS